MLGHACAIPPTGANIAVLVVKTDLTAESSYTKQLAVVGLGVGMMVVWVPYYSFAAVCCLSLPLLMLLLFCFWLCLSMFACACWCAEARHSVTLVLCRPPSPTSLFYY